MRAIYAARLRRMVYGPMGYTAAGAALAVAACVMLARAAEDELPEPAAVRFARLRAELAEANLQKVRAMNAKLAGSVAGVIAADYERDAAAAQQALDAARAGGDDAAQAAWLARAKATAASTRDHWQRAVVANRRKADTFQPIDIERLRLRTELAAVLVEQGERLAAASTSADERLAWRLEVLAVDVDRLNEEVLRGDGGARPVRLWIY